MKANKSAWLVHEYSYEVICQFADEYRFQLYVHQTGKMKMRLVREACNVCVQMSNIQVQAAKHLVNSNGISLVLFLLSVSFYKQMQI